MGEKDTSVISCLKDRRRFAELCNAKLYGGKQIIRPRELEVLDSKEALVLPVEGGKAKGIQRTHDVVMRWKRKVLLMIIALEHQSNVHYAMAVRKMIYDSLAYAQQIREIYENRNEKESAKEEFLSHFRKEDKLIPVIPIVFSCDLKGWEASTDIHGMIDWSLYEEAEYLKKLAPNYFFNLIDINDGSYTEKLKTDLQTVFAVVQYKQDRKKLREYIEENITHISREIYYVINSIFGITATQRKKKSDKGKTDMSNALLELIEEWREEGREEGRQEGRNEEHSDWSNLIQAMVENGEQHNIIRLTTDSDYFHKKLVQYQIKKEGEENKGDV